MALMAFLFFFLFLATFLANPFFLVAHKPHISSRISVVGVVYCNTCSTKTFSKHSYFLPGVDVHIQCKFKAIAPRTAEQIDFTVNRTTDKHGTYKVELANLDGVDCVDGSSIESSCQATLIKNSNSSCKIPLLKSTTDQITIKSKKENHCIYSLNALSYKPKTRNTSLCGEKQELEKYPYNSFKFFLPFLPPYWPPYYPTLPPFPYIPFPPFTYPQSPPSLPFPFPPLPGPPPRLFQPPPPQGFNLGDPRTWLPLLSSPPPPAFDLGDPRTWVPYLPPPFPPRNHNP